MSYTLDSVDLQIVRMLQRDGRLPNVEIARRVGVSEATIRKRLDRMLSDGTIRITAVPDAVKVGLPTVTFILLEVDLSQLDRITDELTHLSQVRALYYTSGNSNLILEAWFQSSDDLLRFLTQHIAAIPGIQRTETLHVLRRIKEDCRWSLPSSRPPQVLVVDDDPDFVEVVRLALVHEGFKVRSAKSGAEALALMRVDKPDLVILDIMMQGILDGIRTGRDMRGDGDLQEVPILMVSSIAGSEFARLLPEEGSLPADNLLLKPIDPSQLAAEVKRLLHL
jgi:Lrp/AsnC family transcriptional regulator for asnA, asnC and gidA